MTYLRNASSLGMLLQYISTSVLCLQFPFKMWPRKKIVMLIAFYVAYITHGKQDIVMLGLNAFKMQPVLSTYLAYVELLLATFYQTQQHIQITHTDTTFFSEVFNSP